GKAQLSLLGSQAVPGGVPVGRHPDGTGDEPGSQSPSPLKPSRFGVPAKGIDEIGEDMLFWMPIRATSAPSLTASWFTSCSIVLPPLEATIKNWQPESLSTGGHCRNCGFAGRLTCAVKWSTCGAVAAQLP